MNLRLCTLADAARIQAINSTVFGHEYPTDKTAQRLACLLQRESDRIYVAEVDGVVAGYVHVADYELTYYDPMKNIMSIAVDKRFQGRGIGKQLLLKAEEWCIAEGACGIRLVSGANREDAHAFYIKMGYTQRSDQRNFIIALPRQ